MAVLCAGECWPGGGLRPAVEDQWGAGALVALLVAGGWTDVAVEARTAAVAYTAVADDLRTALWRCASGRELIDAGYPEDVDIAAELDACPFVPVLRDGVFVPE